MNIKKIRLVSNGVLKDVPEELTIRELKGAELSMIYSNFNDEAVEAVIKNVIQEENIDVDNLTEQDKHQILHTARVLTFGNFIKQTLKCPLCGQIHEYDINYEEFNLVYLDESYTAQNVFKIKDTEYERKIPTAKDFKDIKRFKERFNISFQDDFIILQMLHIKKVNGETMRNLDLLNFLKDLPGAELVELNKHLNTNFGFSTEYSVECKACLNDIKGVLGISPNLFR